MKTIAFCIIGFFALCVLIATGGYANWASVNYYTPKYGSTRSETFKQSAAYNDGMVRDLEGIQLQYQAASPAGKEALRALALHRFEVYPVERMTPDQRNFYNQLKAQQ